MNKFCTRCQTFKDSEEFYQRHDRDGKYSWCRGCMHIECRSINYPKEEKRGGGSTLQR